MFDHLIVCKKMTDVNDTYLEAFNFLDKCLRIIYIIYMNKSDLVAQSTGAVECADFISAEG